MKPINTTTTRTAVTALAGALIGATCLVWATTAHAVPELSLVGGTGTPGGTAGATLVLSGDDDSVGITADVDIAFPTDQLEFFSPVTANCVVDPRLADTHEVAGRISAPGVLALSVLLKGTPLPPLPPLGDGNVATCNFHIVAVSIGTAALGLQDPCLGDTNGACVTVTTMNGAITIANATPTATPTNTPVAPTATATHAPTAPATATNTSIVENTPTVTPTGTGGVIGTPTDTPTSSTPGTPTSTPSTPSGSPTNTSVSSTPTATATHAEPTLTATSTPTTGHRPSFQDSDSCNIVAPDHSTSTGGLALLLAPALLIWARRRRF